VISADATAARSIEGATTLAVLRLKLVAGGPIRPANERASERLELLEMRDAFDDLRPPRVRT
jgi:hypothetical protein